jgi:hypothetical protein
VIEGLRDRAKAGNPQAARELLNYLTRFPPTLERGEQDMLARGLQELDEAELASFEAFVLRLWREQGGDQAARGRMVEPNPQATPKS